MGAGTAIIEILTGQATMTTADNSDFIMLENSIASFDISTSGLTKVIVGTHSWGEVDYLSALSETGTLTRGQKASAYFSHISAPEVPTSTELTNLGADPYAVLFDDFSSGASGWTAHSGSWSVISEEYRQTNLTLTNYIAEANFPMKKGMFRFDARVTEKNTSIAPFGSFGAVWKYQNGSNFGRIRWGSYKSSEVWVKYGGAHYEIGLGGFQAEVDRPFTGEVYMIEGMVAVSVDGVVRCVSDDIAPSVSDGPGFYTESGCAFDDFFAVRYE